VIPEIVISILNNLLAEIYNICAYIYGEHFFSKDKNDSKLKSVGLRMLIILQYIYFAASGIDNKHAPKKRLLNGIINTHACNCCCRNIVWNLIFERNLTS
jgi:hypothetical protein